MNVEAIKFRGHPCFKNDWSGLDAFKPITVIIGRNNSGKSRLLDLVRAICEGKALNSGWQIRASGKLTEDQLRRAFSDHARDQRMNNHTDWAAHGRYFVNEEIIVEFDGRGNISSAQLKNSELIQQNIPNQNHKQFAVEYRERGLEVVAKPPNIPLHGRIFRSLGADRDIKSEAADNNLSLSEDGLGATNIIRRYLHTTVQKYSRERIHSDLRNALNVIFGTDGEFSEIEVKNHDAGNGSGQPIGAWEVFLEEEKKGFVPLSRSGSGLKTVILVLLNLLIIPEIEEKPKEHYVFAFEELENNLHPALLRRLLKYIEQYVGKNNGYVFLTTHSSVMLDVFGASSDAQVISVTHDKEFAIARTIRAHFDQQRVVTELGAKPSDLLQANGVIWVEGPSDRVYINRWIELVSDGSLREGRDYVCAFYGGILLAKDQFAAPEEASEELSNLLRLNANIIVICDSDREKVESDLKDRVKRIREEVNKVPRGIVWITEAKEIENYLPAAVLQKVFSDEAPRAPGQFERFFPSKSDGEKPSFLEMSLKRKSVDKVELAERAAPHMTMDTMKERFDWSNKMQEIVKAINEWNK